MLPVNLINRFLNFLKSKKSNSKRVKATFINFYNHIEMLMALKIDLKASYNDENEKIEIMFAKEKKVKEKAKNEVD